MTTAAATDNTWPVILYGTAWKENATAELVRQAIAAGCRAIDTANQPRHYNEPGVGEGLNTALGEQALGREDLFLQTKFTPLDGHGSTIPYDAQAPLADQVEQSLQGSLNNLATDYLDSYLLHGPHDPRGLNETDWTIWSQLEALHERGVVRHIGISNIGVGHLRDLLDKATIKPMAVQNRCFAKNGWDRAVRELCAEHGIVYQGFSLLTANTAVLEDSRLRMIADHHGVTPQQVIFAFARQIGMLPLTGTTNAQHMRDDLAALELVLNRTEMVEIEQLAG
ncbi:diketogulonate reductase-like aldo/keto reductase [Methylohalomonas lacus]|uniref:Diketogulonate reductase-like aldo/keto reductase n=1 Tax=Methylohalomonas lacus TaxID=398773 RepID=A0AAE3HNR8_9GAMM|nr:aldo/keto reductase [Methylohalomonas lacus]MCS3904097.1 diketogulonate reductase-like aldo/keto reductase [Methylohalomonas lacus]